MPRRRIILSSPASSSKVRRRAHSVGKMDATNMTHCISERMAPVLPTAGTPLSRVESITAREKKAKVIPQRRQIRPQCRWANFQVSSFFIDRAVR